ncbi:MAG: hypothetical protein A2X34_05535 [Elusimicrobia bacterium GWC2_51_8]|nr:MAG: hypothetical protein A2X33_01675 [Elusimicrobia bacterium GWA2_51_34]OGR62510.1 MAG: hypothetical protein A2X34_05535 [Elusimicrobia bacterium GWC2_51_8]OGR85554.1 MAG: hypothetical protein A2021_03220 [Elusimicrobia bacterium GWF2_52_66]HAF96238.1 shikimate kinase [Elusimicrobiota bacterium]HCE97848.1 shikimate kinase [Elusimicrobiota bacterium]
MKNIYLIGFMCAGKTSTGKALARLLKRGFVDSDRTVEKKAGLKIAELATGKGLKFFRKLEAGAVRELAGKGGLVAALGGGIYPSRRWAGLMKRTGITVYLRCAWPELAKRLEKNRAGRPLLAGTNAKKRLAGVEKLFNKRRSFYEKSDLIIDISTLVPEDAAKKIKAVIEKLRIEFQGLKNENGNTRFDH